MLNLHHLALVAKIIIFLVFAKFSGTKIKKGLRQAPIFVNLKSNTMKNTVQR